MGTLNKSASSLRTACAILLLSFGSVACGGDDSGTKDGGGPVITLPDGGTHTPLDSGVVSIDSGFVATTDAGDAAAPPSTCVEKDGCKCAPTKSVEFLNSCTTGTCYPFDNNARIPGFTGTLP